MAHVISDRVRETTSTTGTGSFTLTGAAVGFSTFASKMTADGDTTWYCAVNGAEWEVGLGTRTSATVLERTAILDSSNSGSAVSFTSAPAVFMTMPASQLKPVADKCRVYLGTATNSASAAWAKVPLDTVSYDTNSIWVSGTKRVVPKKAGYYSVTVRTRTNTAGGITVMVNASTGSYVTGADIGTAFASGGTATVYCNGTTDYIESKVFTSSARAITTGPVDTWMEVVGPI